MEVVVLLALILPLEITVITKASVPNIILSLPPTRRPEPPLPWVSRVHFADQADGRHSKTTVLSGSSHSQ